MQQIARSGLALFLTLSIVCGAFAQAPAVQVPQTVSNRIPQPIVVNGQQVNGAYVQAPGGGMQSFTCPGPQEYATPDGAAHGWACFDQSTSVWLLNALPPAPQPAQAPQPVQQPTVASAPPAAVVVQQPATVVYAPPYPVVVRPYPTSAIIGAAVIGATGIIASAAIFGAYHPRFYGFPIGRRRW